MRTFSSVAAFQAEGNRLHPGQDPMQWEFICPQCKKVHKVQDWIDAGFKRSTAARSCLDCGYENKEELPILVWDPNTKERGSVFEFARYNIAVKRPSGGLGLF